MATEAQRRATAKYERNNVTKKMLRLYPDDADVLAVLDSKGRGWGVYLKRLVREDVARGNDETNSSQDCCS